MTDTPPRKIPRGFVAEPFAYHHELEIDIETLTNLGHGLGRVDGWVVMVPFALPGEQVLVRIHRNHKNYSEADLVRVIKPSEHRVEAVCPIFGKCGGCQYQNLNDEEQLVWKRRQLAELLQHMARIEFPVEEVIASPQKFGYRSKITPHFDVPRDGQVSEIGFLHVGSRHRLVDVPRCDLAMPEINERLTTLRDEIRAKAAQYKKGATVLLRAAGGKVLTDHNEIASEEVDGIRFEFQAGDFFQNNPFILSAFVQHVAREATASGANFLIDAYCGSGLFALTAAKHFQEVIGIEISASATAKAAHNALINAITNCRFITGSAEHLFEGIQIPPAQTAFILDPPRAGCGEDFLRQLFVFSPASVVYVSCNPATQMRDLVKFIEAGYKLKKVQPFDLFPQTRHLECVMTLQK